MLVCSRFGIRHVEVKYKECVEEVQEGRCTSWPGSKALCIREMVFLVAGREIAILAL